VNLGNTSFSDSAREVFARAGEEANRLGHERFGAQHILLGVLQTTRGAASSALDAAGIDRDAVRRSIVSLYPARAPFDRSSELPYDESGVAVVRGAFSQAEASGAGHVTSGHVLLAAIGQDTDPAHQILRSAGVEVAALVQLLPGSLDDQ
jgi:ATP-dependent Clp protease ATP-binding subunit ClpC